MTRNRIIAAYLDRLRPLLEVDAVGVHRHYTDALEESSAVYVAGIDGDIELYGAAAEPFQWRDEFTFTVVVQLSDPSLAQIDSADELTERAAAVMDVCVYAISAAWDQADVRVSLVEPGAEITASGPNPIWYQAEKSRLWMATGTVAITLARHLRPVEEQT